MTMPERFGTGDLGLRIGLTTLRLWTWDLGLGLGLVLRAGIEPARP